MEMGINYCISVCKKVLFCIATTCRDRWTTSRIYWHLSYYW